MALIRCGGGANITLTQLGTATISNTSDTPVTLNESMNNYQFIFITQAAFDGDKIDDSDYSTGGFVFAKPSEFSSARHLYWRMGSGTGGDTSVIATDSTSLTFKQSAASNRSYYVYGVK